MNERLSEMKVFEVKGTGETTGEAKWAALRELEKLVPSLVKENVEYKVVSEGERGLLGVGFVEAVVTARFCMENTDVESPVTDDESFTTNEELITNIIKRICSSFATKCTVKVDGDESGYQVTIQGDDLGVVIGRHGSNINAIQDLVQAALGRSAEKRIPVTVDAAGYRSRRSKVLKEIADQAAAEAIATDMEIELEPMLASERKIIHLYLDNRTDVETLSEGTEPKRFVLIRTPDRTNE